MTERRSPAKVITIVVGILVALALIAAAGLYGYRETTAREAALEQLAEAVELMQRADEVVIEVDEVVRAEIDAELGAKASELTTSVADAERDLRRSIEMLGEARPALPDERTAEADALVRSARARLEMLASARPLLEANTRVARALEAALEGWELLLEGEDLSEQAVTEYNKLTKEAAARSQELNTQAETKLTEARRLLKEAHGILEEAGVDAFVAYVEEKLLLIGLSKQADAAYLAGRPADANKLSDQFNAKEKELVEKIKELPETPAAAIANAYEKIAGDATDEYFRARDEAAKADAALERITQ